VTLTNPAGAKTVGFFAGLKVRQGPGGAEVLPITWSDNYVTLWPGQSVTVQASYRAADVGGAVPTVDLSGWNVANQRVSAPAR